ncbi:hypothetical protein [Streptomyces malaysiensis]|uniref:Uncharacterized protein n=1 Tax=Streptomyces malaysiensis subsp. samsunensis TaxID=459658 RepID=A0A9X2RWZ9_STRMQ|nr:hypothetical protein [Streptomyces samsunensis]MCQ8831780.1 hypothetical protein [Streptomyces samsunensis]
MAGSTTWRVHVRIEKGGRYADYNDTSNMISGSREPTERDVIQATTDMIISAHPYLKGGKTVIARAAKV